MSELFNINSIDGKSRLTGFRNAPVSRADLVAAFDTAFPKGYPDELADDILSSIEGNGSYWPEDLLVLISMLSPEHHTRMQQFMKWSNEQLDAATARIRQRIREYMELGQ